MLMTGSSWVSAVIQAPELSRLDFTASAIAPGSSSQALVEALSVHMKEATEYTRGK